MEENSLECFWGRTQFYSFGAFQECNCYYDFDFYIQHEAGDILLPPSPNWFFIDALDSRAEDNLLVSSAYKSILVQQFLPGEKLPILLKVIPNHNEKVQSVQLCPIASEPDYGHTVAALCEGSVVRLFNIHTGDIITEHRHHEGLAVNGICWGNIGGEEVVVTVGEGGRVVVWQPQHNASQLHTLPQSPELSVVEVNPLDRSQALVAASKDIALVNLKTGWILTWLKGHDMNVYCMRWYVGEESPLTEDIPTNSRAEAMMECSGKGAESRNMANNWRRNDRGEGGGGGPYFASSDYGRNIYVWDIAAKRYVTKMNVPVSAGGYKRQMVGKDKSGKMKQHIPLAWYKKDLLSSTIQGELLKWTCLQGKGRYKALHHLHNRAIYNLEVLGDLVVTSGQDRVLHGFDVAKLTHVFQLPMMGGYATTLAFCPQDVSRLAIGSMDNTIRLIKFRSPTPLQCLTVSQNIKGKILSLAWHPEQEGRLLLGTATGQVSWLDVSSCRLTTFAYYHQKSAYKVEWAPPVCPEASGISYTETWYAYSFGDREIVMRTPSSPLADPVSLKTIVPDPENKAFPKDITEFSFSPDYNYLAVGLNDGQVRVYRRQNLEVVATLVVVKKAIQHLLWKPQREGGSSYTLAVGSNENNIYIFCLDSHLKGLEDKTTEGNSFEVLVTQATRELSGHEARVVWLAWSPHTPSLLASASYDHTVQLWDADNGSMLGNYGGHMARVFRAEFSPSDPDLLFSCAEENSLHSWRPSKLTCKTPAESSALLKEYHRKKEQGAPLEEEASVPQELKEDGLAPRESEAVSSSGTLITKAVCLSDGTKKSSGDSGKKVALKSFFPKLHNVCSRKKGFHHLVLLSMLALKEAKDAKLPQLKEAAEKDAIEEDLEDLDDEILEEEDQEEDTHPIVGSTTEKYSFLLEKDSEMARIDDFLYVMQMYGQPHQMDALLASEIETHETKGNPGQANLMHCWRGSLNNHIRLAAKQKKLTPFLVASAPQVSLKLWETACEAYAEQLLAEGDAITAASYLLNIHKAKEAVDILLQHKHFREALAIVKSRLGYSQDQLGKVVDRWVSSAMIDGNMDLAATLQFSAGRVEAAARTLSRRTDPGSLFVSAKLYKAAGNKELAMTSGVMAVREASIKQEMDKVEAFLCHLPELEWFKVISCLHSLLLRVIQQENTSSYSYFVNIPEDIGEAAAEAERGMTCLVDEVKRQWVAQGLSQNQYKDLYQHIVTHLSTQHMPSSVKQLWFLVAVALCKCLLSPSCQLWDQHLTEALKYAVTWGKSDQLLHLTHALLPKGKNDMEVLRSTVPEPVEGERVPPHSLHVLWQLYQQAEVALLHSFLMNDSCWLRLQKDIHVTAEEDVSHGETQASASVASFCDTTVTTAASDGVPESVNGAFTSDNTVTTAGGGGVPLSMEGETLLKGEDEKTSFSFPVSMADLRASLNSYLENSDSDFGVALEKLEVASDGLSSPLSLVKKIIMLLNEKGHLNSAEVEGFLSRLPSSCDLISSSI